MGRYSHCGQDSDYNFLFCAYKIQLKGLHFIRLEFHLDVLDPRGVMISQICALPAELSGQGELFLRHGESFVLTKYSL